MADRDTTAGVQPLSRRSLPGQLRRALVIIPIGDCSAGEYQLLAVGAVVIKSANVRTVAPRHRCDETQAHKIEAQAVALRGIVTNRVLLHQGQNVWIHADFKRILISDVVGRQRCNGSIGASVLDDALLDRFRWDQPQYVFSASFLCPFVTEEEEHPITLNRPAQRSAENVSY